MKKGTEAQRDEKRHRGVGSKKLCAFVPDNFMPLKKCLTTLCLGNFVSYSSFLVFEMLFVNKNVNYACYTDYAENNKKYP